MSMFEKWKDAAQKLIASHPKGRAFDGSKFYPNPQPLQPPVGYKKAPSMFEQVRDMVRSERLAQEARQAGFETLEEADDFDIGDDFDPTSPYEYNFDPVHEFDRSAAPSGEPPQSAAEPDTSPPAGGSGQGEGSPPQSGGASPPAARSTPPQA